MKGASVSHYHPLVQIQCERTRYGQSGWSRDFACDRRRALIAFRLGDKPGKRDRNEKPPPSEYFGHLRPKTHHKMSSGVVSAPVNRGATQVDRSSDFLMRTDSVPPRVARQPLRNRATQD